MLNKIEKNKLSNLEIEWYQQNKPLDLSNYIIKNFSKNKVKKKIHILRNYTCEPIFNLCKVQFIFSGYDTEISYGKFNNIINELKKFNKYKKVDTLFLAIDYSKYYQKSFNVNKNLNDYKNYLNILLNNLIILRQQFSKPIIIQNLSIEKKREAYKNNFNKITKKFLNDLSKISNVEICDELKENKIYDKRNWEFAGLPYNSNSIKKLSSIFSKYLFSFLVRPIKVLATDLDNTMWSGVAGDETIKVKESKINYEKYHKFLKKLKRSGYLLTIVSKNNINTVREIFNRHKFKYLKLSDFIIVKASWKLKSQSLKEINKELNLSEDSTIFIDDSVHERYEVSRNASKVRIFPFIKNKTIEILDEFPDLFKSKLLNEDKKKTKMYIEQFKRNKIKNLSKNFDDYLKLLNQKIDVEKNSLKLLERSSQMETKINQFNMNVSRFSKTEVEKFIKEKNKTSYLFKVKDQFGDNGYVCSVLVERINEIAYIKSFLMSCRVIERNVEYNVLKYIFEDQFKNYKIKKIVSIVKKK